MQVTVDGTVLTPTRDASEPLWHDWNKPLYLGLPAPVLRDGDTTIEIMLRRANEGRLALYPFYVGNAAVLQAEWFEQFATGPGTIRMNWATTIIQVLASLALWRMSPRSLGFGWLALTMGAALVFGSEWAFPNLAPQHPLWVAAWCFSIQAMVYFIFRFLLGFFGDPSRLYLRLMHGVIVPNTLVLIVNRPVLGFESDAIFFAGVAVLALLTLGWLLSLPRRGGKQPHMTLFFMFSLASALAATVWINAFWPPDTVLAPLGPQAMTILIIGLSWSLLLRFDELRRQRDRLHASLAEQVEQKPAELEPTYAALAQQSQRRLITQERLRIMLDLHDGIGGQLVNTLAYMENSGHRDPVLQNAIEDALRDMGLMIDSLHLEDDIPVMLGMIRNRLEPLLHRHKARFAWQVDATTRLDNQTPSDVLALMRIVQEAISNAVKHSSATVITVQSEDRAIRITDNGCGFDTSKASEAQPSESGLGLRGMRQRAADTGIQLDVRSSGNGTVVHLF